MKFLTKFLFSLVFVFAFSCKQKKTTLKVAVTNTKLELVEPPHWWIGFKDTSLQLLVKEDNIGAATPDISYAGVTIKKAHKADSPNYLFIDLEIDENTKSGKFDIVFNFKDGTKKTHTYELKYRERDADEYQGFNSTDVIYLITPDRFANANLANDKVKGLLEQEVNRNHDYKRHGGDIAGITKHLDYINEMGFTQIWSCPLLTNNMKKSSYHGYAITNLYEIDPRFGTLEDYKELSAKAREKGIGLIMDQVANHCGLEHWWMKDLPFKDWVNNQKNYEENKDNWNWEKNINSNHRRTTNQDSYASEIDRKGNNEGWFVADMPDLNQRNPFMANYITQNSIWWIETAQLSGIRQDTYPYPDKDFMSNWAGAIRYEYPGFTIVGEEWSYNPLLVAYWQSGANNKDGYESNLTATMDFPMQKNIIDALSEKESWDTGLVKMYEGLANDFIYANPKNIMVFSDNHDMSRIYTQFKGDITNTKMALSYMLALPRIPQIYYGTEILMNDFEKPGDHGLIRTDFPGGWQGDSVNAFTGEGLNNDQKDMQSFLKKVLNYRKTSDAIHDGETVHFSPFIGTYFLFRIIENETVVVIINKNDEPITIDLKRYVEVGLNGKTLKNIITGESFVWKDDIVLKDKGVLMLTTKI